jgi:mannose-6-phosphate isomerase
MGAHAKAPSLILPGREALSERIDADPLHLLGPALYERGVRSLPFLFKVLDASMPLSIQAHPDRQLAARLYSKDPLRYPDSNHKPELAVCLRGMRALVGFRPEREIRGFLDRVIGLMDLCETEACTGNNNFIRHAYSRLMTADRTVVRRTVRKNIERATGSQQIEDVIFLDLIHYYGEEDPGVFCPYFLNYVEPEPFEGVYLGPNEPHAYLGGEILECMASSDNVVRAGLTKKSIDIDTLLSMLHYRTDAPNRVQAEPLSHGIQRYPIPVSDFELLKIQTIPGHPIAFGPINMASILLLFEGELTITARSGERVERVHAQQGSVLFFPGDLESRGISIELLSESDSPSVHFAARPGHDFGL